MTRSTAGLLLLLTALLGTSAAVAAQRTYDKRLEAPAGGRLTFQTDVGSVTVVGHDAPEVTVHGELQGTEAFLDHLDIRSSETSAGVTIVAHSTYRGWLGWLDWFNVEPNHARFTVEVPRDYPVHLRTAGGDIDIRGLSAPVRAATSGGGARVRDITGAVTVQTSGGSIEAAHLNGAAQLSSSGGGIRVSDSKGDLDLDTSGGGIRLENDDGQVHARTSGGSIRARLLANHGIHLATSGGGITLLLPRATTASIEADASGGGITTDFPLSTTRIASGDHLVGAIGGGGPAIALRSSGGGIHITPEP